MNILRNILLALGVLFVAFIGISFLLPSSWKSERSIVINASPEKIYPLIANFQTGWPQWSDFDRAYADCAYSYSGPQEGVGATRSWVSNQMGDGFKTIIKANPQEGIDFELTMINYGSKMLGQIHFSPVEGGTLVHWVDRGQINHNPIMRWMGLFMNSMLGGMIQQSLINLKNVVESSPEINS